MSGYPWATQFFTGYDRVRAFKGKVKKKPLELILEFEAFCLALMVLGSGWVVPDDITPDVEKFVCALYRQKYYAGVNAERYNLF